VKCIYSYYKMFTIRIYPHLKTSFDTAYSFLKLCGCMKARHALCGLLAELIHFFGFFMCTLSFVGIHQYYMHHQGFHSLASLLPLSIWKNFSKGNKQHMRSLSKTCMSTLTRTEIFIGKLTCAGPLVLNTTIIVKFQLLLAL
jgi:hypothetical protein